MQPHSQRLYGRTSTESHTKGRSSSLSSGNKTSHFRVERDFYERFWSQSDLGGPPQNILRYCCSCAAVQEDHSSADGGGAEAQEHSRIGKVVGEGALILDLAERGSLY